jgi:hypothetical protein
LASSAGADRAVASRNVTPKPEGQPIFLTDATPESEHRTVTLLRSPWQQEFVRLLRSVKQDLFVASPYIGPGPVELVLHELSRTGALAECQLTVLTDLSVPNMAAGGVDVAGLLDLVRQVRRSQVYHLPSVHAKTYIADSHAAVVTSANLTHGGICRNLEYGIWVGATHLVNAIRRDLDLYTALAAPIASDALAEFAAAATELADLRKRLYDSGARRLQEAFEAKCNVAHESLLAKRAQDETTTGIFGRTLLYLLRRGPMRTVDIHPLVQAIHPDLCDDSVDRVIGGVHFGKKWKHYVRTAQQHLKARGLVVFDGTAWSLTPEGWVAAESTWRFGGRQEPTGLMDP